MHLVVVVTRSPMTFSAIFCQGECGSVIFPLMYRFLSTSFYFSPVCVLELSLFTVLGMPIVLTKSCRDVTAWDSFLSGCASQFFTDMRLATRVILGVSGLWEEGMRVEGII